MKATNFLMTATLLIAIVIFFSCNKKDDNHPEPQTGYFAKSMTIKWDGKHYMKINFRYDGNNRLISQTFDDLIFTYEYNDQGQLSVMRFDDYEWYSIDYENNVIVKIVKYNMGTDRVLDESPVTFSNGIYSINGEEICKVDNQDQLLELYRVGVKFSYGEGAGVHQHLALSPARYLVLEGEFVGYDLALSHKELVSWLEMDTSLTFESQRNEQGLITSIQLTSVYDEEYQWDIEYEERELVGL